MIRFGRAGEFCERCGRPHGRVIVCVDDGSWYDADGGVWRSGRGRPLRRTPDLTSARLTRPILATWHREHDRPEHIRRRRLTFLRRREMGDLFLGLYPML